METLVIDANRMRKWRNLGDQAEEECEVSIFMHTILLICLCL